MSPRAAFTGWVLAAFFAVAALLLGWQYAQARAAADRVRQEYESLQVRVEAQAEQNKQFDATLRSLTQQLEEARSALDALDRAMNSVPEKPAQP